MEIFCGARCSEEVLWPFDRGLSGIVDRFQPDFVDALASPVVEKADAVGCRENFAEVLFKRTKGQILEDGLGNLIGRLNIEGDAGDDAEGAEAGNGAGENIRIRFA